jgi:hypothetical protein
MPVAPEGRRVAAEQNRAQALSGCHTEMYLQDAIPKPSIAFCTSLLSKEAND